MMPDLPHTSAPMVMHGRALALKNTCRNASSTSVEKHLSWSRTCIPQRAGCLPPHTDRVQLDIRPTDSPAPSAQKSGNTTKGAMSKPTANEDDPRAQHAAVGAWDNYVDPHPDGDKPRPSDDVVYWYLFSNHYTKRAFTQP